MAIPTAVGQWIPASACAPLSSQREQNYKRSPYSGYSGYVRFVNLYGSVHYDSAVSGGFGVRPALLSEKLCVRRTQAIRQICALSILKAVSITTLVEESVEVSACAPLSFQRETMRSPSLGYSYQVRYAAPTGYVKYGLSGVGGYGVRPALLSEKLCVRRTQVIHIICALRILTVVVT